jgi:hypothetical protein
LKSWKVLIVLRLIVLSSEPNNTARLAVMSREKGMKLNASHANLKTKRVDFVAVQARLEAFDSRCEHLRVQLLEENSRMRAALSRLKELHSFVSGPHSPFASHPSPE